MRAPPVYDILLVEDNPQDVEMTLRALKKGHLENPVHVVRDGAEALDFLFAEGEYADRANLPPPRVVFLDVKVPKVTGLEILSRIKDDARLHPVPVVVLTSSNEGPDVREAYRLGANSYIVKPLDFEKFVDAISQIGMYWLLLNEPSR